MMQAHLLFSYDADFPSARKLANFVAKHARGGLLVRDETVMADAIARGLLVAILSEGAEPRQILAMAGILPLADGKFEIGGALVRPDMTGFGLQRYMLDARLAAFPHASIGPWSKLFSGASRAAYGRGSRAAVERSGFEPIAHATTPVEFQNECKACVNPIPDGVECCYQFYVAGPGCSKIAYSPGSVDISREMDGATLRLRLPALGPRNAVTR
jgi:hypothetical protein